MNKLEPKINKPQLSNLKDFLRQFQIMTQLEESQHLRYLTDNLYKLNVNLEKIKIEEEPKKLKQFKNGLNELISDAEKIRREGIWHKVHPNIFRILGCEYNEKIHSNLLAWLLNPEESHGLKDLFLCSFIREVFNKEIYTLGIIHVEREIHDTDGIPDIVIEGKDWRLVIENKIYSNEGPDQTIKYAKSYEIAGGIGERYFLVFLTPGGKEPLSSSFHPVSYKTIAKLLEQLLPQCQGEASIILRNFTEHIYLDLK